jgi:hypothetical protein
LSILRLVVVEVVGLGDGLKALAAVLVAFKWV